jgi:hypothetical protein
MEIIAQEQWAWTLFQEEAEFFLSVLCGTVGLYEVVLKLSPSEATMASNREALNELASKVRSQPKSFAHRQVANFDVAAAQQATTAWQRKRSAT